MQEPQLVIIAAGIGNRYGGLKQFDSIGPNGEILIDYSLYDAMQAGFKRFVFVIRKDIEQAFRDKIGKKFEKIAEVKYAYQELDLIPDGYSFPETRSKPWGTGHAALAAKDAVDAPCGIISADDFLGRGAYETLYNHVKILKDTETYDYCMVGFILENTLSDNGYVSRAICKVSNENYLENTVERKKIKKFNTQIKYTENDKDWITIPQNTIVALIMWGFTPSIFQALEERFKKFLDVYLHDSEKEFFLPYVVNQLIQEEKAKLKVLSTTEKWYGLTYPEDKPLLEKAINEKIEEGIYPLTMDLFINNKSQHL